MANIFDSNEKNDITNIFFNTSQTSFFFKLFKLGFPKEVLQLYDSVSVSTHMEENTLR